ncbi:hypothetical protein FOZ60_007983 [Perkinsus olseni]|uniref:Uncharacterized protein n=1 Tax=Perkinsus olseni TaxID=32597 RepID=A0A7J6NKB0_PEROL|nr:hypothetical protein FOZ60_007983 [Perkinsus olseni]
MTSSTLAEPKSRWRASAFVFRPFHVYTMQQQVVIQAPPACPVPPAPAYYEDGMSLDALIRAAWRTQYQAVPSEDARQSRFGIGRTAQ